MLGPADGQGRGAGGRRTSAKAQTDRSRETAWSTSGAQHLWGMERVQAPRWRECLEIQLKSKRMEDVGVFFCFVF